MSSKLMIDLWVPLDFLEFCCDSVISPQGQGSQPGVVLPLGTLDKVFVIVTVEEL